MCNARCEHPSPRESRTTLGSCYTGEGESEGEGAFARRTLGANQAIPLPVQNSFSGS